MHKASPLQISFALFFSLCKPAKAVAARLEEISIYYQ